MKEIPFSTILAALTDADRAFPERYVSRFSDLQPADLKALLQAWPQIPLKRKKTFLTNLVDRFEEDLLLSYEAIGGSILFDEDADVRVMALKLLDETIDARLIPTLIKLLETDPEAAVRARAATVLGQFVRMAELGDLPEGRKALLEDVLFKAASDKQHLVARAALESLAYSSSAEVDDLITAAFNRPDPLWQATALFAAGRSSDNRWQEQILLGLLSEDMPVRLAAVQSAGDLELKSARKVLLEMLEDEADDDVFQALIWALSQIGGEDVRTYLEALLAEAEGDEQIEFIEEALANLSFTEDMEGFDMLAIDPDDVEDLN